MFAFYFTDSSDMGISGYMIQKMLLGVGGKIQGLFLFKQLNIVLAIRVLIDC